MEIMLEIIRDPYALYFGLVIKNIFFPLLKHWR
jgi:hypothetical protein